MDDQVDDDFASFTLTEEKSQTYDIGKGKFVIVLKGIFLLFFHKLCVHVHVHRTTFERKFS